MLPDPSLAPCVSEEVGHDYVTTAHVAIKSTESAEKLT